MKEYFERPCSKMAVEAIRSDLRVAPAIAQAFANRGCANAQDVKEKFLTFGSFADPMQFRDMKKAIDIIRSANKILVWGDYDVDGTCATSIMLLALKTIGKPVQFHIPQRKEGYGLNNQGLQAAAKNGCDTIITVDCGITAVSEVAFAKSLGLQVVVTDHHEPGSELPEADAILDPKVKGENYTEPLCGAGVAAKLAWALAGYDFFRTTVDLIAVATVADLVPLRGENHLLVKAGLMWLKKMPQRPGMAVFMPYCLKEDGDMNSLSAYHFGFKIGPMINAAGRMAHAAPVVEMLTTTDMAVAQKTVEWLNLLNEQRKQTETVILESVHSILEKADDEKNARAIVLASKDASWNAGVIGIAASQITEELNKPCILLSWNPTKRIYHGSCRSIDGVNIFEVLQKCNTYLQTFGGHEAAAGLSLTEENLDGFKEAFLKELESFPAELFLKKVPYDGVIQVKDSVVAAKALPFFEPTGIANPQPTFLMPKMGIKKIKMTGQKQNIMQATVYDETGTVDAVMFEVMERPQEFIEYDLIVTPKMQEWNGKTSCKIVIRSMQPADIKDKPLSDRVAYASRTKPVPIELLGFSAAKNKQFHAVGIHNLTDLLEWIPTKYHDFRNPKLIREMQDGEDCAFVGYLTSKYFDKKDNVVCTFQDRAGDEIKAYFFGRQYVYQQMEAGREYILCGKPKIFSRKNKLFSVTEWSSDISSLARLLPVYKKVPGMSFEYLSNAMAEAFKKLPPTDYLEKEVLQNFGLYSLPEVYQKLHFPVSDMDIHDGQKRLAFDKLFAFSLRLKKQQIEQKTGTHAETVFKIKKQELMEKVMTELDFDLTNDQKNAVQNLIRTMGTQRLNALVQGDVGSGKTIVAFLTMIAAMENHLQSVLLAPTEVLASQHNEGIQELAEKYGFTTAYLTGSTKAAERKKILKGLADGSIQMLIGTHAVLQDDVQFQNLGLVIIDEQHRFGVEQRTKLTTSENPPHLIVMSATPIPRTLSMAMYGDDIQVETIKEMPAGRKPVQTLMIPEDENVNKFILQEVKNGHQAYVICPLIDESDKESMTGVMSVETVSKELEKFAKKNPEVKPVCISGKMKQAEIQEKIKAFADGAYNVLISTTIVEVGVNIPNATLMVLKSSERFGLAQAHQLRGRVGRGSEQAYCILQPGKEDMKAEILCRTTDGFEISKQDMLLRGAGDFVGTSQHGKNSDIMLMLAEPVLYQAISKEVGKVLDDSIRTLFYQHLLTPEKNA